MTRTPATVKRKLKNLIHEISQDPTAYVQDPDRNFTRKSVLNFEEMVSIMLRMEGKSVSHEMLEHFKYRKRTPSASAFVQQRSKIRAKVFETIFTRFTSSFHHNRTYNGYRLLAVDGSDLQIATNPNDKDSFFQGTNGQKPYNLLHLNAFYDLLNNVYLDATVEKKRLNNEIRAAASMVDRSDIHTAILLADRGYESYNLMAHVKEKGWRFLIRIKDSCSTGIASGLDLPNTDEFDLFLDMNLVRRQTRDVKSLLVNKNHYKFIPSHNSFDYLPVKNRKHDPLAEYPLPFRIVRFNISDDVFETVVTNLDPKQFPPCKLRELYALRWGIETSFRALKYTVGLIHFHAKKVEHICQEIFARLTMYNFAELLTSHVIISATNINLEYKVNFSTAVQICRQFFLGNVSPPELETLLSRYISPIRPNRIFPRSNTKKHRASSFAYRIA